MTRRMRRKFVLLLHGNNKKFSFLLSRKLTSIKISLKELQLAQCMPGAVWVTRAPLGGHAPCGEQCPAAPDLCQGPTRRAQAPVGERPLRRDAPAASLLVLRATETLGPASTGQPRPLTTGGVMAPRRSGRRGSREATQ